jgi:hypothetical protein
MLGKGFGTAVTKLFRKTDPDTSFEAALSIDTKKCEQLVYETIASFPDGCIQDEVLQVLSFLPYSSVTARFKALKDKGYIEVIGTRKGRSGKNQSVLKVKHG